MKGEPVLMTLMGSAQGAYRITTTAPTYLIDLDRMVLRRSPRTEDSDGSLLRRDHELITLLAITECTVRTSMVPKIDESE
jgi:aminoglycoside phosphotransferase (APT) family kinase protein